MSKRAACRRSPTSSPPRPPAPRRRREPRQRSVRSRLVKARVAGRHDRLGRTELHSVMRRVVGGDPVALLGLERFDGVELAELRRVASDGWGWDADEPDRVHRSRPPARGVVDRARPGRSTSPDAAAGSSSRPAGPRRCSRSTSTSPASRDAAGGHVLDAGEAGPIAAAGRAAARLWWIGGVAVLTDGEALLADPGIEAVDELLFTVPFPDLVVADRGFAGGALRAGIEVVAFADLDGAGPRARRAPGPAGHRGPASRASTRVGVRGAGIPLRPPILFRGHLSHSGHTRQRGTQAHTLTIRTEEGDRPRGAVVLDIALSHGAGSRRADAGVDHDGLPADQGG